MSELTIASIVATGKFDREFDLIALTTDLNAYSCNYSPDKLPGVSIKFYEDGPSVTIFRSGSFNIRGASSTEEVYKNKSLVKDSIQELGIEGTISSFDITNIVFTSDIGEKINLNKTAIELGIENVEYEPEQFPGLVYRVEKGVILVFSTGKLVITGVTNTNDAKQALDNLMNCLSNV